MNHVNLKLRGIDKRDVTRIEMIVGDMLAMYYQQPDYEIEQKIKETLYNAFFRVYFVNVKFIPRSNYDFDISIIRNDAETKLFEFDTWSIDE